MKEWVKRTINEHAHVVKEINNVEQHLDNAIASDKVNKVTAANLALLYRDLKNVAKDYQTILENENIQFSPDGGYWEKVAKVN